ncbi:MAG: site-2 protease family protein [Polyangiales bacterium]
MPQRNTRWALPLTLIALTFGTTFYAGAMLVLGELPKTFADVLTGWVFSVPLMAILLAHEFGHFFAGKYHRVDVSPPYFIPLPLLGLGTLGAVIQIRERIRSRNALLDIGAAGPLAGMAVALPVLIYGLATSPIQPIPDGPHLLEGRSLLYLGLLFGLKGPIPEGFDIMLNPTAFAGWAGLLVTMINLIPFGQLDGGHVAYALLGPRQNRVSHYVLRALPILGVVVSAAYAIPTYLDGVRGERLSADLGAGFYWLFWALLLWFLTRATGPGHPPTDDDQLSPRRRLVGVLTLFLFVLLFMPNWLREQ